MRPPTRLLRPLSAALAASLALAVWPAEAGPRASSLMRESRTFLRALRTATAQVTLREPLPSHLFASGARPDDALDEPYAATLQVVRGRALTLTRTSPAPKAPEATKPTPAKDANLGLTFGELALKDLKYPRHGPELRLLTLALASPRFEQTLRRLGVKFFLEVMTLDRIDGRLVWAIGDEHGAVWLDRETYQPVRIHVGEGVVDEVPWVVEMRYDEAIAHGWFPAQVRLKRAGEVRLELEVTSVELNGR